MKGFTPNREDITKLSEELNLKENQIYKWFWDTKKKVDEDTAIAKSMNMSGKDRRQAFRSSNRNSFMRQDSHGQLMPPKERECIGVDGKDGLGEQMTPQQIKTALKIHQLAAEKEADFEAIAKDLGLDIEGMALHIVSEPSPTNRRQTVRKVNAPSSSMDIPSFNMNMFTSAGGPPQAPSPVYQTSENTNGGAITGRTAGFNSVRNNLVQQQKQQKVRQVAPQQ